MKTAFAKFFTAVGIVIIIASAGNVAWATANSCPLSPTFSPDFSSNQSCLTLNGINYGTASTAYPSFQSAVAPPPPNVNTILRLTPAAAYWAGSAWYNTPQPVAAAFSTTFTFQISGPSYSVDADGIAFVIQNSSLSALGPEGCGEGFGGDTQDGCTPAQGPQTGIPQSIAVRFNTYPQSSDPEGSVNNVTIQSCGTAANSIDSGACQYAAYPFSSAAFSDGNVHTATVAYTPSTQSNCGDSETRSCSSIDVILDGTDLFPGGQILFNMASIGLTDNNAWVGFTGATGGANSNQDILSWVFSPQGGSQTGTVGPGQTSPTTFNVNGGFQAGSPTSGYDFNAQETDTTQTVQMVVTAIPISQQACSALVQANSAFSQAECMVYQNGGGQGSDTSVMFEVTCPPYGSCGSASNPFDSTLGSDFNFSCAENSPLQCGPLPAPFSFGLPNLTSLDGLPEIGFLKGDGPDPTHPCTPYSNNTPPLFLSNQIESFTLGDISGGAKGGGRGTTSCWLVTYLTGDELPTTTITQPASGGTYYLNEQDATTVANYSCNAVNQGTNSPAGPYLTVSSCAGTDSPGGSVANGTQFDTSNPGPHTFTVQVQDSAYNTNSQTISYSVVPGQLGLETTPSILDFGTVYLNHNKNMSVKLTNVSGAPITITGNSISLGSADANAYRFLGYCRERLKPGASCIISLAFHADTVGTLTATLNAADTAAGSPLTIPLTVNVIDPLVELSPRQLVFGKTPVNTPATLPIQLTNVGLTNLAINAVRIDGTDMGDFTESHDCPSMLAPTASCTIEVTFTPQAVGRRNAGLLILDNIGESGHQSSLQIGGVGTGLE